MCMIVLARRVHPRYPLVMVANRDEIRSRPAEPLHEWTVEREGAGGFHAGRDVTAGGTWLALAPGGRVAAVTNVREPGPTPPAPRSRGELPVAALTGAVPVTGFAAHVVGELDRYGPVNLLAGDTDEMRWASNRSTRGPLALDEGVHGLSNAALDTPWPKVTGAVAEMRRFLGTGAVEGPGWSAPLLHMLADRRPAPIRGLPHTGVSLWREWRLSSRLVGIGRRYGTRSTTAIRVDEHGTVDVVERTWDERLRISGTVTAGF